MTVPGVHPDDFSDEGQSTEEDLLAPQEPDDIDPPLHEPRPSFNSLFKKFTRKDARRESKRERAYNSRVLRRRMHGRKKQAAELIRKRIDPEDIRSKMRYVAKLLRNRKAGQVTVGYINVEQLAWKIFNRFAIGRYKREPKVFVDDIIQQMALILLTAPEGHTESWYRKRAYNGVKNFVSSGTFNPENKYFASRRGWDKVARRSRLVVSDNIGMLENRFYNTALAEGPDFEDGNYHRATFDSSLVGDPTGCSSRSSPVLFNWGNPFTFQNRGYWINRFSEGVQHFKFISMQLTKDLPPARTALTKRILRGDDFGKVAMDAFPRDRIESRDFWKKYEAVIEAVIKKAQAYEPKYTAERAVADSVQQFIMGITGIAHHDCSDLYPLRTALKDTMRLAVCPSSRLGWGRVQQMMKLETVDQEKIIYEQYMRVAFERARLSVY